VTLWYPRVPRAHRLVFVPPSASLPNAHNRHWFNCCRFTMNLSSEYINEFQNQCLKLCLELWRSLKGDLRHGRECRSSRQLSLHRKDYISNKCHHCPQWDRRCSFFLMSSLSVNIRCAKVSLRCGVLGRPAKGHKVLSWPLAIRNAQLLQGIEPLHNALEVALVSLRTYKAIVEGVLTCELPCGGAR